MATDWGAVGGGAASGAATGTMILPGWGTAIGAGLGAGLGWLGQRDAGKKKEGVQVPHFQPQYDQYTALSHQADRRGAPLAKMNGFFRDEQIGLTNMLRGQANGQGPGQQLVAAHAQAQADQAHRQQLSAAQSARPGMGAAAAFHAAQAGGQAQSAVGQQRVMGGLQAQLNAIGQLGNVTAQGRGMDDNMKQFNAGQHLQNRTMNDARALELLRQRMALSTAQQGGGIALAGQPSAFERTLGMGMGAMQMAQMYRSGQQQGGQSNTMPISNPTSPQNPNNSSAYPQPGWGTPY